MVNLHEYYKIQHVLDMEIDNFKEVTKNTLVYLVISKYLVHFLV